MHLVISINALCIQENLSTDRGRMSAARGQQEGRREMCVQPHHVILAAIERLSFDRCRPHPKALGARPVGGGNLEPAALPQELVEDVALSLSGPTAHRNYPDRARVALQGPDCLFPHLEPPRCRVESDELHGVRMASHGKDCTEKQTPLDWTTPRGGGGHALTDGGNSHQ